MSNNSNHNPNTKKFYQIIQMAIPKKQMKKITINLNFKIIHKTNYKI